MVSQPNLSRTFAALEAEVGALLFQQEKGKTLVFNENGKQLSDIDKTVSGIQNSAKDEAPSIRLCQISKCMIGRRK